MTINVKPLDVVAKKWMDRSTAASGDYRSGVERSQGWAAATLAAKDAMTQGWNQAMARGAFEKGVRDYGDEKWKQNASGKGADRYTGGITAGQQAYQQKVAPYLDFIKSLTMPKAGPRGSAENKARQNFISDALFKKRTGGVGGSA